MKTEPAAIPVRATDWLPLVVLPATAIATRHMVSDWVFMWLLALALFLGCKWLTLRRAAARHTRASALPYLLAWPGMDADSFLAGAPVDGPKVGEWLLAGFETVLGATLMVMAARPSLGLNPLLTGWLGMVGIVLTLHFGLFQLLALAWRAAGRDAQPLMRAPLLATSLADFWGRRWNTAFNKLAHDLVFRRLARPFGVARATFGVFLVSGLVHDLVISVPARGGYGLPTGYFLIQGGAVMLERSRRGRALGLGQGWRGRAYALAIVAVPAFGLFHPTFVHRVILPMIEAISTISAQP